MARLLTETLRAAAAGATVGVSLFVEMDFASGPMRLWSGFGPVSRGGHDWRSAHGVAATISGLGRQVNGTAGQANITLSAATPEVIAMAYHDAQSGEVEGRDFRAWLGFWDATEIDRGGALVPLDSLIQICWYQMQLPTVRIAGTIRTISLPLEGLWVTRDRAVYGMLTNRDQQARWPGDRGLEWTSWLTQDRVIKWPRGKLS